MAAEQRLNWSIEQSSWPHAESSRFIVVNGRRWHVQVQGDGPTLLLLHGTGASTHSWRILVPMLAERFTVIAPDLPGHGFTDPPLRGGYTLPAMAAAVAELMEVMGVSPDGVIGHSAGAAIAVRCCLDGLFTPDALIGINAALLPFHGAPGVLFPPLARLIFMNPMIPRLFARSASKPERVERLLQGTGSSLDAEGLALYRRLFENPSHVAATLGMMANWDLRGLRGDLPKLDVPLVLVVAEQDRTIPPSDADRVQQLAKHVTILRLPGLGHLAHEEDADAVLALLIEAISFARASAVGTEDFSG
jgi:magnesium chelatase accessory protein